MRTRLLNKQGMKLMISVILLVAILSVSMISAFYIIDSRYDVVVKDDERGESGELTPMDDRNVDVQLKDGEVPGGPDKFEQLYTSDSNWMGIGNQDDMRAWLISGDNKGKNAYLTNSFDYVSNSIPNDNCSAVLTGDQIRSGRILDGCGNTVTLTANVPNPVDAVWSDQDGAAWFVYKNFGTMRNINFSFSNTVKGKNDEGKTYWVGLIMSQNAGVVHNVSLDFNGWFEFNGGKSGGLAWDNYGDINIGIFAGSNNDGCVISDLTIKLGPNAVLYSYAYKKGKIWMGGICGWSKGVEQNITFISDNPSNINNFNLVADTTKILGLVSGWKGGGSVGNLISIGTIKHTEVGSCGVAVGDTSGSVNYGPSYCDYSEGINSNWLVGNGGGDWRKCMAYIDTSLYDISNYKPKSYFDDYVYDSSVIVLTPKNKPNANDIPWSVKHGDAKNDDVYESIATGSFKTTSHKLTSRKDLVIEYGSYGDVKTINVSDKEYNAQHQGANAIVFNNKSTGTDLTVDLPNSGINFVYNNGTENVAEARNVGNYVVTMSGIYCDLVNKFIGIGKEDVGAEYNITPYQLDVTATDFDLSTYTKVYNGTEIFEAVMTSKLSPLEELIQLTFEMGVYNTCDVLTGKELIVYFSMPDNIINANYELKNTDVKGIAATITPMPYEVLTDHLSISTLTKVYDKTNAYNGTVTAEPIDTFVRNITSQTDDIINLNISGSVYNSANVFDTTNLIISFTGDNPNYKIFTASDPSGVTLTVPGATITPDSFDIDYNYFSGEAWYNDDGSSKITREYSGLTDVMLEMDILKAVTTPLDEKLKLIRTGADFADANMGTHGITMGFGVAQEAVGTSFGEDTLSDWRNYTINNSSVATTGSITPKIITMGIENFTLRATKEYDGTTDYIGDDVTYILGGVNGEKLTLDDLKAAYSHKNVLGDNSVVLTFKQNDANYALSITAEEGIYTLSKTATITAKNIVITRDDINAENTKSYDGNTSYAGEPITQNQILGVGLEEITLTDFAASYNDKNVANANNMVITFKQGDTNYTINESIEIEASIYKHVITVGRDNLNVTLSKTYDGNTGVVVSQNVISGVAEETIILGGISGNYADMNEGAEKAIHIDFALEENEINANYSLFNSFLGVVDGEITALDFIVTKDMLTNADSKTYDGTTEYMGSAIAQNGEIATLVNDDKITLKVTGQAYNNANVSGCDKLIVNITQDNKNYNINSSVEIGGAITPANLTVDKSAFTVDGHKNYDGGVSVADGNIIRSVASGVNNENVGLINVIGVYNDANVANANAINVSFGIENTNYILVNDSVNYTTEDIEIAIAPYDIELALKHFGYAASREYSGDVNVTITLGDNIITGIGDETLTLKTFSASYNDKNVAGADTITFLFTSDNANYNITNSGSLTCSGAIEKKLITVTANDFTLTNGGTKTYDGEITAGIDDYTISGVASETITLENGYKAEYDSKDAKIDKKITITFTANAANYSLENNSVITSGVISPKSINIEEKDIVYANSKVYDGKTDYVGANIAQNEIKTGVGDETITLNFSNPRYNDINVNTANNITIDITQNDTNYVINETVEVTANITPYMVDGPIDPLYYDLTINKQYDGSTNANVTIREEHKVVNGIVGETFNVVPTAKYDDIAVGESKTITIYIASDNDNYDFVVKSFIGSEEGIITGITINVTADKFEIEFEREYSGNNVAIIKGHTIKGASGELIALDSETTFAEFDSKELGEGKTITIHFYPKDKTYAFDVNELTIATGKITQKKITLSSEHFVYTYSKDYDGTTDYIGYITMKGSGIGTDIDSDSIIVEVTGAAVYNSKNVSDASTISFDVSLTGGTNSGYYIIDSVATVDATITAKMIYLNRDNIVIAGGGKVFDNNLNINGVNTALGELKIAGVKVGDNTEIITLDRLTAMFNDASGDGKNVGVGKGIVLGFDWTDGNYIIEQSQVEGETIVADITPYKIASGEITVEITTEKTYDGNSSVAYNDKYTVTVTTGEEIILEGIVASYDNKNANSGKTITIRYTQTNGNYVFADIEDGKGYQTRADGVIKAKDITVVSGNITVDTTKVYNGLTNYIGKTPTHDVIDGICGDDEFTLVFGTIRYDNANVNDVTKLTVQFSQTDTNYNLTNSSVDIEAVITPADLTLTLANFKYLKSRAYNANTTVDIIQNEIIGQNGEEITLTSLGANYADKNVVNSGNSIVIEFTYDNTNYRLTPTTSITDSEDISITPYIIGIDDVTIKVTSEKEYNANNVAIVDPENCTVSVTTGETVELKNVSATYDNANYGISKVITAEFAITDTNYSFDGEAMTSSKVVANDGIINKKGITVLEGDIIVTTTKAYDATTDYVGDEAKHGKIAGECGNDEIVLTFGAIAYDDVNVGDNRIITVNFTLAQDSNYDLGTGTSITKDATITPYEIDTTKIEYGFAKSRVYNGNNIVSDSTNKTIQVKFGEITEDIDLIWSAVYDTKNVGASSIIVTVSLAQNGNYALTADTFTVTENVGITKFTLTAENVNFDYESSKTYDGNDNVNIKGSTVTVGFEDSDLKLASYSGTYSSKNFGNGYEITFVFTIDNGNYMFDGDVNSGEKKVGGGEIAKAKLTPSASDFKVDRTREYTGDDSATLAVHNGSGGVKDEKVMLNVLSTKYIGSDYNVGEFKVIKLVYELNANEINGNYELVASEIEVSDCGITAKKITIDLNSFTLDNGGVKTYDGKIDANVGVNVISGVLGQTLVLSATAKYNDMNAGGDKAITITFELTSDDVNKNYSLTNEINTLDTVGRISAALLNIQYDNLDQTYRDNKDPLGNVAVTTLDGLIGADETAYTLKSETDIEIGAQGVYNIIATPTNTNYYVTNGATLNLFVFKKVDGKYIIETIDDFNAIDDAEEYLAFDYKQMNNIDVKYGKLDGIKGNFTGSYDGSGKTISNAFIIGGSLFETVSGSVTGLGLVNTVIIAYNPNAIIGGIVGTVEVTGSLNNVLFEGSIYVALPEADSAVIYVGGIAGINKGKLNGVTVIANIDVISNNAIVGGLAGLNSGEFGTYMGNDEIVVNNTAFVEIVAQGAEAKADYVAGENTSEIQTNNAHTNYMNGGVIADNGTAWEIKTGTIGTAKTYYDLAMSHDKIFAGKSFLELMNYYSNDYKLKLSYDTVLNIDNLRDYELIGQYNYLNVKLTRDINFHKNYQERVFDGIRIGAINLNGFKIDERVKAMYQYEFVELAPVMLG